MDGIVDEAYGTRDANYCYYQEPSVVRHTLSENILRQIINNDACVAGLNSVSYSTSLEGDWVERVGGAIANNRYLQSLYIENDIYGLYIPLFRGLARNRSITHLELHNVDLSQADTVSIMSTFFFHNDNLRFISICGCSLPHDRTSLILAMSKCNKLERIELRSNDSYNCPMAFDALHQFPSLLELRLEGSFGKINFEDLVQCVSKIVYLQLESCDIDDESFVTLIDSFVENKTIKKFEIITGYQNRITGSGWRTFAAYLRNPYCTLEELAICSCDGCNNGLDDQKAFVLAESLATNSTLTKLNMSTSIGVTAEGWITFFNTLLHSQCSLEELDLSGNVIDDEGALALINLLATFRNLRYLHLNENCITSNGLRGITRLLQPNSELRELSIQDMNFEDNDCFNDEVFIEFVDVLSNNTSLQIFLFDDYEITDQIWTALSHILCDKTSIERVYFSNHTLHNIGSIDTSRTIYHSDIKSLLCLNEDQDKTAVIRQKILKHYFSSDVNSIEVFACMSMAVKSRAIEWIGKDNIGFTLMYNVTRGIPSLFASKISTSDIMMKKRKLFP